jgi:ketosteroid isomerase-like protein
MSRENVDIVKRGIDAFNRRDRAALAAMVTPDFEWLPGLVRGLDGDVYRGIDGIDAYFADLRDTFQELRVLTDDYSDLGDRVLALGRTEARGAGSGAKVDAPLGIVFDFTDGRISRANAFLDHAEALRAVGLER